MPDPFENIKAKIGRAREHIELYNRLAHEFYESDFYTRVPETHRNGRLRLRVGAVSEPDPILGILIGESAHQLRSILDHLLFHFAKTTNAKEERDVQFPLASTRQNFGSQAYRLKGVPRRVRALVKRLQPYHRRTWKETALLGRLREISNWDKHRALSISAASVMTTDPDVKLYGTARMLSQETFRGVLKPGAILASIKVADAGPESNVTMQPKLALTPIFDKRMPEPIRGRPVIGTLRDTFLFVANEVLPRFEALL